MTDEPTLAEVMALAMRDAAEKLEPPVSWDLEKWTALAHVALGALSRTGD